MLTSNELRECSEFVESLFPRLGSSKAYQCRSERNPNYNCIAFAAGVTDKWWQPRFGAPPSAPEYTDDDPDYWPLGAPHARTQAAFMMAFECIGYEVCADGTPEEGFEKVVLYAIGDTPMHAARQDTDTSMWLSKLGKSFDIAHPDPRDISGDAYGEPFAYLRKPVGHSQRPSFQMDDAV